MTKCTINPTYADRREVIEGIIEGKYESGLIHRNKRNCVELVTVDGQRYVVKRYNPMSWFHVLLYTFFRRSKAYRAYTHAAALINSGIGTAYPIAYVDVYEKGLFSYCLFISGYVEGRLIVDIYGDELTDDEKTTLCNRFGAFTADLHNKGFMPTDYNPGNVIYKKREDGTFEFALIDINRMTIGRMPTVRESVNAFNQVGIGEAEFDAVFGEYLKHRQLDAADVESTLGVKITTSNREAQMPLVMQRSFYLMLEQRRRWYRWRNVRHHLKRMLGLG
jgi:tRNA A-37 threonylcarbamoyl transferase component Bud32